ncbi:MAG: SH3 domain-containing protein, partial [Gemmatimonadales bacterium]
MDRRARDRDDLGRKWVPDARLGVFEIAVTAEAVRGATTSRDALDALRVWARTAGLACDVRLLPDASVGAAGAAVVTAALAPLTAEPRLASPRVSEALHGECLDVLECPGERSGWLRVRARDGYVGWLHGGYAATGPLDWAGDWEARATARALGADIHT